MAEDLTPRELEERRAAAEPVAARPQGEDEHRDTDFFQGVSGGKQSETALRESEQRLELALEATNLAIYEWDLLTDQMIANRRFREMVGLGPDEPMVGATVFAECVHPDDRARIDSDLARAMDSASDGRFVFEHRLRRVGAHGEPWMLSHGQVYFRARDGERQPARVFGTLQDITERKRAEILLGENEKLQAFLLKLSDALRPLEDPLAILQEATKLVAEELDVTRVFYFEVLPDGDTLELTAHHTRNATPLSDRMRISDFSEGRAADYRLGKTLILCDSEVEPHPEAYRAIGVRAVISVPLVDEGRLVALVGVNSSSPRKWTNSEVRMLEEVASRTSGAVARARAAATLRSSQEQYRIELERQVRERTAELQQSRDLLQATMDGSEDLIQVFQAVRDPTGDIIDFCWVLNNHTSEATFGEVLGESLLQHNPGVVDVGIFETFKRVVETGEPNASERHYVHEQFDGWFYQSVVKLGDGVATTTKDITAGKEAQNEVVLLRVEMAQALLRESEQNLHGVANIVPDLLWYSEPSGSTPWYNDRWLEYTGQTFEQASGWGWVDAIHPDDRQVSSSSYSEAVRQGKSLQREHRIRRHTGEYRWFLFRAEPLCDEHGQVKRMYGAATDIHDQRLALQALQESEDLRRIALESGGMGAWTWNTRQGVVRADAVVQRLWGVSVSEQPHAVSTYSERMYPEGVAWLDAIVTRSIASGQEFRAQLQVASGPASGRWVQLRGRADEDRPWIVNGVTFDVTDQKAAEQKIRDSEERLTRVLEGMGEAFGLLAPDFTILEQNREALRLDGRPREEIIGRTHWDVYPGSEDSEVGQVLKRAMLEREPVFLEHRHRNLNGDDYWLELRAYPTADGTLAVFWRDITDRREAADALRRSEQKYRMLFESIDEGFVTAELLYDSEGRAVDALFLEGNPAASRLTGGKQFDRRLLSETIPGAESYWLEACERVSRTGSAERLEFYLEPLLRWYDMQFSRISEADDESRRAVAVVFQDVTDRKHADETIRASEGRLRLFVENVREYALVQTDLEGMITSWNPGAERLFQYESSEIVGQHFARLLPEEDRHDGLIAREMAALSQGRKHQDAHAMLRKDGTQFWAEWVTEPVLDYTGRIRGTAKVLRDDTERRQAETATRISLAEKEQLLKEVHHRVKNNLQVISSLVSLQSLEIDDERFQVLFDETRNRIFSIASIHERLYQSANFAQIELLDYARQIVPELIRFYGAQKRVRVEFSGKEIILELERAVPFGLLLNELASNALKHAFPGDRDGLVRIEARSERDRDLFVIADNGIGLPAGFELGKARSLGLRLSRRLAEQLGGAIVLTSGPGTVVEVRFPKHRSTSSRFTRTQ